MDNVMNNTGILQLEFQYPDPPFSQHVFDSLTLSVKVCATGMFAMSGLVTNVINVVVFYRQGILTSSSTLILTGLTVSDFFCCLLAFWSAICAGLYSTMDTSKWSWDVGNFVVLTANRPINYCTQVTCWITAFLTFERAFSVIFPFKVNIIFTPRRSLAVVVLIFLLTFLLYIPNMLECYTTWDVRPGTNVSYVTWKLNDFITPTIHLIYFYTNPFVLRFLSISIVIICNVVIVWKVNLSQKFRKSSAPAAKTLTSSQDVSNSHFSDSKHEKHISGGDSDKNANKNKLSLTTAKSKASKQVTNENVTKEARLLKMITIISVVFTISYSTNMIYIIIYNFLRTYPQDYHWQEDNVVWNFPTMFQIINSSTNIFIYFPMSSRYRHELKLCLKRK